MINKGVGEEVEASIGGAVLLEAVSLGALSNISLLQYLWYFLLFYVAKMFGQNEEKWPNFTYVLPLKTQENASKYVF